VLSLRDEKRRAMCLGGCTSCLNLSLFVLKDGNVIVNWIGRYESLDADFAQLCQHLGKGELVLPKANIGQYKDIHDYFDAEPKQWCEMCMQEISFFSIT
jgi:hypothetical protein